VFEVQLEMGKVEKIISKLRGDGPRRVQAYDGPFHLKDSILSLYVRH